MTDSKLSTVYSLDIKKGSVIQLASGQGFAWRIAADPINRKLFWSNVDHNFVMSSDFEGANLDTLGFVTYPQGIALDTKNKWVYVSEAGTPLILRLSYDGVKRDTLVSKGIYDVDDIRVDTNSGYLFYIDVGSNNIGRIDLGNFENELMIDENDFAPISLEIDYLDEMVYWGDDNGTIYGMNYWGQNITTIVSEAGKPTSLAIDLVNNELYWTDVRNQKLLKKKLDSDAINEIPNVVINNFHMSLALLHKTK